MIDITTRGPNGQFIPYRTALAAWLPVLMQSFIDPEDVLREIQHVLTARAADCLQRGSNALKSATIPSARVDWAVRDYERTLRKRDAIRECVEKLAEVSRG